MANYPAEVQGAMLKPDEFCLEFGKLPTFAYRLQVDHKGLVELGKLVDELLSRAKLARRDSAPAEVEEHLHGSVYVSDEPPVASRDEAHLRVGRRTPQVGSTDEQVLDFCRYRVKQYRDAKEVDWRRRDQAKKFLIEAKRELNSVESLLGVESNASNGHDHNR